MFMECLYAYRNPKTLETLTILFWFRYETFINFFEFKVFRHEERETISYYTDFSIWPHYVRHPAANYWSVLGELRKINFLPLASNLN